MIELLAENNFGDTRSGSLAGPTGLVIILLLAAGTILLIRNLNTRLRRLPERFEPERYQRRHPADHGEPRADGSTGGTDSAHHPAGGDDHPVSPG